MVRINRLTVEKRALAIHLMLIGRARVSSLELEVTELKAEERVKTLLNKLYSIFLADKGGLCQFMAFHDLYNFRRYSEVSVSSFVAEFEFIYFKFSKQGMTLPDTVMASMLLAA